MNREFREASDLRSSLLGVGIVVVSAAVLRYWGVRHGAPTGVESGIVGAVLDLMRTGSYRPNLLAAPTLPLYLQALVAIVHFLLGAAVGAWRSVGDFDAAQIVPWGRGWSALLGTAAVFVVYHIGTRWGARHALLAAGLMAVTPMHVAVSREIGDGAPFAFFAALTLLLSLAASERGTRRRFALAGAAAGLAAASHYAGALTIVMPLVSAWMTRSEEGSRLGRASAVVACAIVAFVAATPLSVRDLPAFLNGFAAAAAPIAPPAQYGAEVGIFDHLLWTLQWPGVLLALAGALLAVVRAITGPGHTRWTILGSFPLLYLPLVAWHGAMSDAALAPVLPPITVLAAVAVVSGVSQLRRFEIPRAARTALIAALTVAAVLPPALFSIELVRVSGRAGTSR